MASDYEDFDENFDEDFDEDSHEFAPFDVALASLEDSDRMVRVSGDWITLRQLEPAALAQHAEAVVARLEDSELQVRVRALDTLAQLEPAALAQHAEAVVASLEDSELQVRVRALTTLAQLEPSALTQHAEAVVARLESMMLEDLYIYICIYVYIYIYIYIHIMMLEDHVGYIRIGAYQTLCRLEPAALAQHAHALVSRLTDPFDRVMVMTKLRAFPRVVTRDIDFESHNCRERLLGRLAWFRCRLRLRVRRIALYWYAQPYRPSGPGHARDVRGMGSDARAAGEFGICEYDEEFQFAIKDNSQ